jgi:hypothetical protein
MYTPRKRPSKVFPRWPLSKTNAGAGAAVHTARAERFEDARGQTVRREPSVPDLVRRHGPRRAFRRTVRTSGTNGCGIAVESPRTGTANLSRLGQRARDISSTLKDRIKRVFLGKSTGYLPEQHVESRRLHFDDYVTTGIHHDGPAPPLPNEELLSRNRSREVTDHELPAELNPASRPGSIRSVHSTDHSGQSIGSRVTSWTNSTAANTLRRLSLIDKKRLSIIDENGAPHQPSSSAGCVGSSAQRRYAAFRRPAKAGLGREGVDGRRLFSALQKKLNERDGQRSSDHPEAIRMPQDESQENLAASGQAGNIGVARLTWDVDNERGGATVADTGSAESLDVPVRLRTLRGAGSSLFSSTAPPPPNPRERVLQDSLDGRERIPLTGTAANPGRPPRSPGPAAGADSRGLDARPVPDGRGEPGRDWSDGSSRYGAAHILSETDRSPLLAGRETPTESNVDWRDWTTRRAEEVDVGGRPPHDSRRRREEDGWLYHDDGSPRVKSRRPLAAICLNTPQSPLGKSPHRGRRRPSHAENEAAEEYIPFRPYKEQSGPSPSRTSAESNTSLSDVVYRPGFTRLRTRSTASLQRYSPERAARLQRLQAHLAEKPKKENERPSPAKVPAPGYDGLDGDDEQDGNVGWKVDQGMVEAFLQGGRQVSGESGRAFI